MTLTEQTKSDLSAVADAIRQHDRFCVTSHENPDGDALGSLLATHQGLRHLGQDAVIVLGGDAPLPAEYRFLDLGDLQRSWPGDLEDRVLLAVDCAQENRIEPEPPVDRAVVVLDVDHHHDNTRFGDVNLVVPDASSSAEV